MIIKQLSVFLENKTGSINDVTRILGAAGINMYAFSLAETADFGILRLIVSEVDRAAQVLRDERFAVRQTDVVCFTCPNRPGALAAVLDVLAREQVFIEYMYAFSEGATASVVIRPTDIAKCVETLGRNRGGLIDACTLG
ncbi:MAG: amino acid-binding protein [Rikenellaceae bacterium]|nr:amino acid-binding protein [Rikenellaceae bacterium]